MNHERTKGRRVRVRTARPLLLAVGAASIIVGCSNEPQVLGVEVAPPDLQAPGLPDMGVRPFFDLGKPSSD